MKDVREIPEHIGLEDLRPLYSMPDVPRIGQSVNVTFELPCLTKEAHLEYVSFPFGLTSALIPVETVELIYTDMMVSGLDHWQELRKATVFAIWDRWLSDGESAEFSNVKGVSDFICCFVDSGKAIVVNNDGDCCDKILINHAGVSIDTHIGGGKVTYTYLGGETIAQLIWFMK